MSIKEKIIVWLARKFKIATIQFKCENCNKINVFMFIGINFTAYSDNQFMPCCGKCNAEFFENIIHTGNIKISNINKQQ